MPHLVILYTGQLDHEVHMTTLCRQLADAMLDVKDEAGQAVFPTGGTRVLAYPAPHYAVADGGAAGQAHLRAPCHLRVLTQAADEGEQSPCGHRS